MAKGDVLLKVLEKMEETAVDAFDLFAAFLNAGYGASAGKLKYEFSKIQRNKIQTSLENETKQKYYKLVYKLKRNGLIQEKTENKKKIFAITNKGINKLTEMRLKVNKRPPSFYYPKNDVENKFTIVIFDVPETERRKRDWLRSALKNLDLRMIQKSVWIGKTKMPKQFLEDLNKMRMIDFVEIFEISKTGSLKQVA